MNLARLLGMGPAELVVRGRQEVAKWTDRTFPLHRERPIPTLRLTPLAAQRFFPGAVDDHTPETIARRMPEARYRVLDTAQTLLEGRFDLLGYRGLRFGEPLDWHLDPVSGRRAPLAPLEPAEPSGRGDRRRQQGRVGAQSSPVARAPRPGLPFHGRGALCGGLRAAHRGVAGGQSARHGHQLGEQPGGRLPPDLLVLGAPSPARVARGDGRAEGANPREPSLPRRSRRAISLVLLLARTHTSPAKRWASFYASVVLDGLPEAERWRRVGRSILDQECARQILPDGTYFEQSTCYQRYTAEIYLHYLLLAQAQGQEVAPEVRERVSNLLDALLTLCRPDGRMPQIGDADGGWLLPLDVRGPDDARGIFSTAAVVFRRPDYAWAAGELAPETIWLIGPAAVEAFDSLRAAPPAAGPSQVLPDGGYVSMRSGWKRDADQILFDVGPLGCPFSGGHGHADLLGVQCTFGGRPYIVDPGTFQYTGDEERRAYFRSSAAHSTVEVDGTAQAAPAGPFSWRSRPGARLLSWHPGRVLDVAEGEHRGYEQLPGAIVHRRKVILVRGGFCAVVDDLLGSGEHRLDVRFQFAPMPLTLGRDGWASAGETRAAHLFVRAFSTVPVEASIVEGIVDPLQGWVSTDYGRLVPAPMLLYALTSALPARLVTLLLPSETLEASPAVSPIVADGILRGVQLAHRHEALYVDGDQPRLERA